MRAVAIVDTSILCNVLNIPHKNGEKKEVLEELEIFLKNGTALLLPMATVYETGNHIAQLRNGTTRRHFANIFIEQVKKAVTGEAPWQVMQVPTIDELSEWLSEFPEAAMRGAGMGDLSIINEWKKFKVKTPYYRVFIWALDSDLQGYDHFPSLKL